VENDFMERTIKSDKRTFEVIDSVQKPENKLKPNNSNAFARVVITQAIFSNSQTTVHITSFKEWKLVGMDALKLLIFLSAIKDLDSKHLTGEV
jgi:UTP-glucose-1-phosphate uridylyltransferase